MKTFKEYLAESKKTYDFKIKIAGDFSSENEGILRQGLEKYSVSGFKKVSTTPTQALPLDFPRVKNCEVSVYEVSLEYPTTSFELREYITASCQLGTDHVVVRNPNEPSEAYQQPSEKREGALLNDPDYKEVPAVDSTKYYGAEYNTSFVKALNDNLKANRKERGEVIPAGDSGKTTNDVAQNNTSPIVPRKN
jgi:hypothetical protein